MNYNLIEKAAREYGTPLYLFDLDILKSWVEKFRKGFGPDITLTYSMKTNPFVTKAMSENVERIEVCSYGEFLICRELGIAPEKLYISGILKVKEELEDIMSYVRDLGNYTAESLQHVEYLNEWAVREKCKVRVYPRLTNKTQFGMDEDTIINLLKEREAYSGIEFVGIHFFSGTQKRKLEKHQKELDMLDLFFERLEKEADFTVPELEYGTGFAVKYFEGKEVDMRTEENIQAFAQMTRDMKWDGKVTIEMGRAFAADCGYYVTKALDRKNNNDHNYVLVDGGIHQINYDGQIKGMYKPMISVIPERSGERKEWTICGSLCTMNDVLCKSMEIADLQHGDLIVFHKTGAYSVYEGMSLFLSHELPAVVLYSEEHGLIPVRERRQSYTLNLGKY